jgi:NADH-quinone oxidoreductase subunit N
MLPIILLSVFGIANLFLGFLRNRPLLLFAAVAFTFITFAVNLLDFDGQLIDFGTVINNGMLITDKITVLFSAVILLSALLIFPLSEHYLKDAEAQPAEYYAIMLFSLVGAVIMVSYTNLLMLFVGVEILSVSMYVLTGSDKRNLKSNEAALKYFLMGSFATGIMLFGMALLYGAVGNFTLGSIAGYVAENQANSSPMLHLGLALILIGILFKVSAAPFHFWTPDVYEGAPSLFTAFMSTIVKTAGFAALFKLLAFSFAGTYTFWSVILLMTTVLTLLTGNLLAVYQNSFKRMMAYSSISHAGYLLLAVFAFSTTSVPSLIFYSLAYSVATISAFGVLILVSGDKRLEDYDNFNGLARQNPFLALVMTISMLSLAGIPLTAGFFGKFYIFASVMQRGEYWLLIVAVLMSAVGIYYYFRVIIAMYMKEADREKIEVSPTIALTLLLTTILTLTFGLAPDLLLGWMK